MTEQETSYANNSSDQATISTQKCNRYTAPEIIAQLSSPHHNTNNVKSDIYLLGMLTWHALTHQTPFSKNVTQSQIMDKMKVLVHKREEKEPPLSAAPETLPSLKT